MFDGMSNNCSDTICDATHKQEKYAKDENKKLMIVSARQLDK